MNIEPLSKKIYNDAVNLRVEIIKLNFHSEDGDNYVYVELDRPIEFPCNHKLSKFIKNIENWAWDVYPYKVLGNRAASGEIITYDLNKKVAKSKKWRYERQETETDYETFALEG